MKRLRNLILGVLVLLVVCGCEPTVDELIEQLKRGYISKEEAVDALVKIGTPAVESLIGVLRDEDWRVQEVAAFALGKIGDERAVEPLIAALGDEYSDVREAAASALVKIGTPAVDPLIAALGDEDWRVRAAAASALGKIGDKRAVEPLIAALRDGDSDVREAAAEGLDKLGWKPKDEKEKAIYLVAKKKWDDCVKIGTPAVEPLIGVLRDEGWTVRKAAASALGKIGDKRAVEALIAALRDGDSDVREAAASALEKINPNWHTTEEAKKQVPEFIAALRDKDWRVRRAAASALEKINPNWHTTEEAKKQVPEFIAALRDKDWDVREAAAKVLDKLGWEPKDEKEKAIYLIAKKEWDECVKVGKLAVEPLIAALRDKDWDVREAAASALGKIGDKAISALVLHLRDWYTGVHVADILDKLGWQPTTDEEKVHYLVAKRKVDELRQIWNITKRVLLKDIKSNDYRVIENAVHALLSIQKGEILQELIGEEIIQELINILNRKGTKEMAEVYLNCDIPELFKAASFWASWHGFKITVGIILDPFSGSFSERYQLFKEVK
jgi:HEAT repeat protein